MQKLAIVGTHAETRSNAPFDDTSFDVWVFNEAPQALWCKRWTACFQLHKREVYESPNNFVNETHWDWLRQDHGECVIWMQDVDERVPNSRRMPLDEIRSELPAADLQMLTSTPAQSLALALYLGYEQIEVWGVELSSNTEYAYQLPGWVYWCGVAKALLGKNFVLHSGLVHFTNRVYGYEGETQIDRAFYEERVEHWKAEKRTHEGKLQKLKDRIDASILDGKPDKFYTYIVEAQNVAQELGEAQGALQEAENYAARTDPIPRQQFERRGAQAQLDGEEQRDAMNKKFGETQYIFNAWKAYGNYESVKQLRMFYVQLVNLAFSMGGNAGVYHENAYYMNEYDNRVTAAGGERTLTALGVNNGESN